MVTLNSVDTSTIEKIVDQAVDYFRDWTSKELDHLLSTTDKNNLPIITTLGKNGYIVGNYAICCLDHKWWRVCYRYSDQEYIFANKIAAIHYAICQQTDRYVTADRILKQDQEVGRHTTKSDFFKTRFNRALQQKNSQKSEFFKIRYQETAIKLSYAKSLLEKSLRSAKYF